MFAPPRTQRGLIFRAVLGIVWLGGMVISTATQVPLSQFMWGCVFAVGMTALQVGICWLGSSKAGTSQSNIGWLTSRPAVLRFTRPSYVIPTVILTLFLFYVYGYGWLGIGLTIVGSLIYGFAKLNAWLSGGPALANPQPAPIRYVIRESDL